MIIIHVEPICLAPPVLAPPKLSAVAQHHLNISKLFFYNLVAENFPVVVVEELSIVPES